jgi:hypothetical protein
MKITVVIIGILLLLLGLGWLFTGNAFFLFKVFAPNYEQVRRETFEQSKAYRQGAIQELQNMQFQYEQASDDHKAALAAIILRRAADFKELPPDLRGFVDQLKSKR